MAASRGHESVARLLLEAGADKDSSTKHGETALMLASGNDHPEVVRLLLEAGANLTTDDGETVLELASDRGHPQGVHLLLEFGADQRLVENHGPQALWWASHKGHWQVLHLLLEAGADKNMPWPRRLLHRDGYWYLKKAVSKLRDCCSRLWLTRAWPRTPAREL